MEVIAIGLTGPVALVASAVYCLLVTRAARRWPRIRPVFMAGSLAVLALLVVEGASLAVFGATRLYGTLGTPYYAAHLALFLLGTPALANLLALRTRPGLLGKWYVAPWFCAVFAVMLTLFQYGVSEALFGID